MVSPGTTSAPTAVVASPPITPAADVIVAPLISETSDAQPTTNQPRLAGRAGGGAGSTPTLPKPGRPGREIGEAWIHLQSPSWIYVSITAAPDTPLGQGQPGRDENPQDEPDHDSDGPVTCTLIPSTGAIVDLGTFTLRNGHADWAARTTIDPLTLTQAQLTIEHGHTLARATFTPAQVGKDNDHDKDRDKAKGDTQHDAREDSKDGGKDEAKESSKDKDTRDDTEDSTTKETGKDGDNHNSGGGHSNDAARSPTAERSDNGHRHDGSTGTRDSRNDHPADRTSASHHDTNRHDGRHRGHTHPSPKDHHGGGHRLTAQATAVHPHPTRHIDPDQRDQQATR